MSRTCFALKKSMLIWLGLGHDDPGFVFSVVKWGKDNVWTDHPHQEGKVRGRR